LNKESTNTWLCHQLGSREHYSIPRALHRQGCLGLLQTDAWLPPQAARWLPGMGPLKSLAGRYHAELTNANVGSFTPGRLKFDTLSRLRKEPPWQAIIRRNEWFQAKCLPGLRRTLLKLDRHDDPQATVFSYSYTARELFREAKRHGARCVLGQIDPGPEEIRWVADKCGELQPNDAPPASYWDAWREEVALADTIITNSEWSRQLLIQGGVPQEKLQIIPLAYQRPHSALAAPTRCYPDAFTSSRKIKVLFLGQIIPRKGLRACFDALPALAGAPVEFHFAGPVGMPIPAAVKAHPDVHFHGPVPQTRARELYRDSDIFVLPTHSDGFAITQLEAAAHHLPIIASKNCAAVVVHDKNGLLLDEITPAAIAQAIRTCLDAPASLARWAEYDLDWSEYSLETLAKRLLALGKLKS